MTLRLSILAAFLLSLTIAGCGGPPPAERAPLAGAAIGGPFTLADKNGRAVNWSDFAGRYRIVYFGYTFCPDACPTDVSAMMRGFALFEKAKPKLAAQVQPLFITIDPARDTPQVVGEFAQAFSQNLMGLTGTPTEVAAAAKAFAVYYAKGKQTSGGYLMDHQRTAYLMGRNGEPIAILPTDLPPEQAPAAIAAELEKWVK